jgi:uncharacterized protein YuzE
MGGASVWSLRKKTETGSFRFFDHDVRYRYDGDVDALTLRFSNEPVARTQEVELGLIDLDADGKLVAIEVFSARKTVKRVAESLSKAFSEASKATAPLEREFEEHDADEALDDALLQATKAVAEASERVKILA